MKFNTLIILILLFLFGCEKIISDSKSDIEVKSFYYKPQLIVLDSISDKLFDIDTIEVDSVEFEAVLSASDIYSLTINNVSYKMSKALDTLKINIAIRDLFSSTLTYGDFTKDIAIVTSSGDVVETRKINFYIQTKYEDPYYKYCWHLNNLNSEFYVNFNIDTASGIHVEKAWEITKGEGVVIAIIDDNFEKAHEDLHENIIEVYNVNTGGNEAENDGYDASHGSTCAGFAAAPHNGIGVVGVAPKASLLLIANTSFYDSDVLKAFDYAKERGAKVVSCSWGSYDVSGVLVAKLKELYDAGITVLFANGNNGYDLDKSIYNDESEVPWVLGIGASAEDNDYTSYTNYGSEMEVIAPGGDYVGVLNVDDTGEKGSDDQYNLVNENYAFTFGTSFSTPITAGVVALMLSANPTLTPDEIRTILIETADKVGGSSAEYDSTGFDKYRAYGKVNAEKAVKRAAGLL